MARADLLCDLIKSGLMHDDSNFRKAAEAICAEERSKQHVILAQKIDELLSKTSSRMRSRETGPISITSNNIQLFQEKVPQKRLDNFQLPDIVTISCKELIE